MGRHARDPEGAATRKITVRLPESVAAQWTASAAAAGMTVSDWIRLRAAPGGDGSRAPGWVGRRPPRRREGLGTAVPPPVDPAVVAQLARIGNNLNQIARAFNRGSGPLDVAGLAVLQSVAEAIDAVLAQGLPPRRGR